MDGPPRRYEPAAPAEAQRHGRDDHAAHAAGPIRTRGAACEHRRTARRMGRHSALALAGAAAFGLASVAVIGGGIDAREQFAIAGDPVRIAIGRSTAASIRTWRDARSDRRSPPAMPTSPRASSISPATATSRSDPALAGESRRDRRGGLAGSHRRELCPRPHHRRTRRHREPCRHRRGRSLRVRRHPRRHARGNALCDRPARRSVDPRPRLRRARHYGGTYASLGAGTAGAPRPHGGQGGEPDRAPERAARPHGSAARCAT